MKEIIKKSIFIDVTGVIVIILVLTLVVVFVKRSLNKKSLNKGEFSDYPKFFLGNYLQGSPTIRNKTEELYGIIKDDNLLIVKPDASYGTNRLSSIKLKSISNIRVDEASTNNKLIIKYNEDGLDYSLIFKFDGLAYKSKAFNAQSEILYHRKNA